MKLTLDQLISALNSKLPRGATYSAQDLFMLEFGVKWAQEQTDAETERLQTALGRIAEHTASNDPRRSLVQIARDALQSDKKTPS